MKIFAATLLLHNLPSAAHPPLPSAKRFFIVARQCYLEMKTIKQPYYSIVSSIILRVKVTFTMCHAATWQFSDQQANTFWHSAITPQYFVKVLIIFHFKMLRFKFLLDGITNKHVL